MGGADTSAWLLCGRKLKWADLLAWFRTTGSDEKIRKRDNNDDVLYLLNHELDKRHSGLAIAVGAQYYDAPRRDCTWWLALNSPNRTYGVAVSEGNEALAAFARCFREISRDGAVEDAVPKWTCATTVS